MTKPAEQSLDQQLQALSKRLKEEQRASEAKKATLERDVVTLQAKVDALSDELAEKKSSVADLEQRETDLLAKVALLASDISDGNRILEHLRHESDSKNAEVAELDVEIKRLKAVIRSKLANYKASETERVQQEVEAIESEVVEANIELESVKSDISEQRKVLSGIHNDIDAAKSLFDQTIAQQNDQIATNQALIDEQAKILTGLTEKVKQLELVRRRISDETSQLQAKHDQFVEYERTARKILDAKDKSLQEREANISQAEVMLENRRSFLPKM